MSADDTELRSRSVQDTAEQTNDADSNEAEISSKMTPEKQTKYSEMIACCGNLNLRRRHLLPGITIRKHRLLAKIPAEIFNSDLTTLYNRLLLSSTTEYSVGYLVGQAQKKNKKKMKNN
ncbi:Hypothetical predicted protein [Octopus vulgaris]|uniref:Uncharacterized protein n=1 Tax=Octopus vulgaris TaxID=6645 RepID=A0AA36FB28_OCTVU|nr:Hypothetical predicted protein [Octopus vulgaris]